MSDFSSKLGHATNVHKAASASTASSFPEGCDFCPNLNEGLGVPDSMTHVYMAATAPYQASRLQDNQHDSAAACAECSKISTYNKVIDKHLSRCCRFEDLLDVNHKVML